MILSQIKLVVSDLDGTLLNSKHEVSSLFFKLFEDLKKHDILFVAASGRPYYSITEKLNTIKDDIIIIAENGGIAMEQKQLLLSTPLNTSRLVDITKIIDANPNIHPVYCTKNKAYFSNKSSVQVISTLREYYPNFDTTENTDAIEEDIIKIALYHAKDSETYLYPLFKTFETDYDVKISGKYFLDISDPLANKGHALNLIQQKYNITPDQTLVFGDYNNDLEMLKLATFSVAMANAHKNVLAAANYKTKSNDNFGVEVVLKQLLDTKANFQKR